MASNKLSKKNININTSNNKSLKQKGSGSSDNNKYIFKSLQISTQPNTDINYKEIGIIHITESGAVNAITNMATGFANVFGAKGFDNSSYDKTRNLALEKISSKLLTNQKICNLRMDVENIDISLFFIHLYGTLLTK